MTKTTKPERQTMKLKDAIQEAELSIFNDQQEREAHRTIIQAAKDLQTIIDEGSINFQCPCCSKITEHTPVITSKYIGGEDETT